VLLGLLEVNSYSLLRKLGPDGPKGFACIPVPVDRLVAPGERATMHFYDTSTLRAVRHAQAFENSTLGQVVIDEAAMRERKFRVMPFGTSYKILSVQPSTHSDKFGGSSNSLKAEVIGTGIIEVASVIEKMPFMTVELCGEAEAAEPLQADKSEWEGLEASLTEAAQLCADLDHVASFKGQLTRFTEQASGSWSLDDCVDRVLGLSSEQPTARNRLRLTALASTVHLPGELKMEAVAKAQQGDVSELAAFVGGALKEEGRRRLALKALSGLSAQGSGDAD